MPPGPTSHPRSTQIHISPDVVVANFPGIRSEETTVGICAGTSDHAPLIYTVSNLGTGADLPPLRPAFSSTIFDIRFSLP